ncbi:MAG: hypothetical protein OXF50_15915 [Caldilineaceae bacterium]|nr:hypothetical protein [Caldilineaceae bacterium]
MSRSARTLEDRLEATQPDPPERQFSLFAVREMTAGVGGTVVHCTIRDYCRTQVFEFPRIVFTPKEDEPPQQLYSSPTVQAFLTSNLVDFFENSTFSKHYSISPSLRHRVCETDEQIRSQEEKGVPVFLVIEESNQLTPVNMLNGECSLLDEVVVRDGEKRQYLVGGREGEKFIAATLTVGGSWPELPNNQHLVNMILAGIRAGQEATRPIRKYLDLSCLVTDDGQFVTMLTPRATGGVDTSTTMNNLAYRVRASEIRSAISALEQDTGKAHMKRVFNSTYRDQEGNDDFQRLHYLQLWQSFHEAGSRFLLLHGQDVRDSTDVVAGRRTPEELRDYRNEIAHWGINKIDGNYLADLQRTINELIRHNYF